MRKLDLFAETNDTRLFVGPGNTLKQTFVPQHDRLSGIRLFVFNPKLGGKSLYKLLLIDNEDRIVWQDLISESSLGWEMELRTDFTPFTNSKNKKFTLLISTDKENNDPENTEILSLINKYRLKEAAIPQGMEETIDRVEKNYLSLAYGEKDLFAYGEAYLNETELNGDLVIKTYYSTNAVGFIGDSLKEFGKKILIDRSFIIFYLLLVFIITYLVFWKNKIRLTASIKPWKNSLLRIFKK